MPCSSAYSDRFVVEVLSANTIRLRCLFCSNDVVVFVFSGANDWENAFCCFALVHLSLTEIDAVQLRSHVNPIRRLLTLLQAMAKKITEEGKQEEELYNNFACYCRTTSQELKTNVEE